MQATQLKKRSVSSRREWSLIGWFCVISLVAYGCQTTIPAQPLSRATMGLTYDRNGDYRIGKGDELLLKVHGDESLTSNLIVQENGQITMPLGGSVTTEGLTVKDAGRRIETLLASYMVRPRVALSVTVRKSFKAYFGGEVVKVGPVQLEEKVTLLKGLTLAGGLTPYASKRIVVLRKLASGQTARYAVDYRDLLNGGEANDGFLLERGDTVIAE